MNVDIYDGMNAEELKTVCVVRGKPNWRDFPAPVMRELLRADDIDRDELELWKR